MGQYSIKELEVLTGIKAHTIRIWEKRYSLISPKRTTTNIRFYSDEDLKKIINISLLNNNGLKISKLVDLSIEEISRKVIELNVDEHANEFHMNQLITSMIDLEEESFEKILHDFTEKVGFERVVVEVFYPFLQKIGILWHTGNISPAQEHFITNLIRQKMMVAIDQLPIPPKKNKRAVLYLPENELHEIGLLFYHYISRKIGLRTYYLGQTVPYIDLKSICKLHKPDVIITVITTSPKPEEIQDYLTTLCHDHPNTPILVTGSALSKVNLKKPKNLIPFRDAGNLRKIISTI